MELQFDFWFINRAYLAKLRPSNSHHNFNLYFIGLILQPVCYGDFRDFEFGLIRKFMHPKGRTRHNLIHMSLTL